MSDHIGAKLTYPLLPGHATSMLEDKGYDSDEYRAALQAKGISPCIPPRKDAYYPQVLTKNSIGNATKLKICSGGSKTGGASILAMIDPLTPSYLLSPSLLL